MLVVLDSGARSLLFVLGALSEVQCTHTHGDANSTSYTARDPGGPLGW